MSAWCSEKEDPLTSPMYHRIHQTPGDRPHLYIETDLAKPPIPSFFGIHPHRWTKDDVRQWLEWCIEEYALEGVQVDKFACMNGKALCMLTRQNFSERASNVGDVLYNTLQQRLVAATSPDAVIIPQGTFYPGLVSPCVDQRLRPSYEGRIPGVASPASPHDHHGIHSPLVAASPPIIKPHAAFSRQHSMPSRHYITAYRSISRSPSPGSESPINLTTTEANREATSNSEHPSPRQSLIVPSTLNRTLTPSPPDISSHKGYLQRLNRQISEGSSPYYHPLHHGQPGVTGSRSPTRRPAPSVGLPEPAQKVAKMTSSGPCTSSPLLSPTYVSSNHLPFRGPSPEGFHDISKKLAFARLDSHEDTLRYQENNKGHPLSSPSGSLFDGRQLEAVSDAEGEDGMTGSDISVPSECESPVEDGVGSVIQDGGYKEEPMAQNATGLDRQLPKMHQYTLNDQHGRNNHAASSSSINVPHSLQIPIPVANAESSEDFYNPDKPDSEGGQGDTKLLWEFIYQLLRSPDYTSLVRWEDEARLVFRIINPAKLAYLWGLQKSRDNMTYEKLSRALRYYYRMNIIVKEPHRRLTYRFVKPPEHIQRGQKGAKPGVSHKRRNSGPQEVPRISVSTPPSLGYSVLRLATQDEINGNILKHELPTASVGMSVFPTGIPMDLAMLTQHGFRTLHKEHSTVENTAVRPELMSRSSPPTPATERSLKMPFRHDEQGKQLSDNNVSCSQLIPSDSDHAKSEGALQQQETVIVKQELPQMSPTDNGKDKRDQQTDMPVTDAGSNDNGSP